MAIQSASAVGAYLTSGGISAPAMPETEAQAAPGDGTVAQGGAASREAPAETVEDAEGQADEARDPEPATYAGYGSNARSVTARAVAGSISFYA